MQKMKLIILLLLLCSCSNLNGVGRLEKRNTTFSPEDYVRLDGYYYNVFKRGLHNNKDAVSVYIFYSDRSMFRNIYSIKKGAVFTLSELDSAITNHKKMYNGPSLVNTSPITEIKNYGYYEINKNNINILYFVRAFTFFREYDLMERKGVLLNDSNFKLVQRLDHTNDDYNVKMDNVFTFRKLKNRPKPQRIEY